MTQVVIVSQLIKICQSLHHERKNIVLATGVFDLFHKGHQEYLAKARQTGDVLLVGVEADKRVKALKGDDRPINTLAVRLQDINDNSVADYVFALPEDFGKVRVREKLIAQIKPDILALSAHSPFQKEKIALIKKYGGIVKIVSKKIPNISTTLLISKRKR